jgi:hypothetical protein
VCSIVGGLAWMFGTALALRAGWFPGLRGWLGTHPNGTMLFVPQALMIPGVIVSAVIFGRSVRRSQAALIAAQGRLCLNCRYDLGASAPSGACPECGEPYDVGALKRGWCRRYPRMAYEIDWPGPESGSGTDVPSPAAATPRM